MSSVRLGLGVALPWLLAALSLAPACGAQTSDIVATRGFLGFRFDLEPFDPPLTTMVVTGLYPGGPADRAGMRVGDVVHRLNGVAFRFGRIGEARSAFDWVVVEEPVGVTVERDGTMLELRLVPDPMPAAVVDHEQRSRAQAALRQSIERIQQAARQGGGRIEIERRPGGQMTLSLGGLALDPGVLDLPPFAGVAASAKALAVGARLHLALQVDGKRLSVREVEHQAPPG